MKNYGINMRHWHAECFREGHLGGILITSGKSLIKYGFSVYPTLDCQNCAFLQGESMPQWTCKLGKGTCTENICEDPICYTLGQKYNALASIPIP